MKRALAGLGATLLVASLLAGCSGGNASNSGNAGTAGSNCASSTAPTFGQASFGNTCF